MHNISHQARYILLMILIDDSKHLIILYYKYYKKELLRKVFIGQIPSCKTFSQAVKSSTIVCMCAWKVLQLDEEINIVKDKMVYIHFKNDKIVRHIYVYNIYIIHITYLINIYYIHTCYHIYNVYIHLYIYDIYYIYKHNLCRIIYAYLCSCSYTYFINLWKFFPKPFSAFHSLYSAQREQWVISIDV